MVQWKGPETASPGLESHSAERLFFPVYHIRRHVMAVCPMSGDGNSDHLIKVEPSRFLHSKVTPFPLE